ncbi:MAG: hypothetical protein ACKVH7_11515 [Alphaproteobacteria bacterium]|jgi:hypothetical protein
MEIFLGLLAVGGFLWLCNAGMRWNRTLMNVIDGLSVELEDAQRRLEQIEEHLEKTSKA